MFALHQQKPEHIYACMKRKILAKEFFMGNTSKHTGRRIGGKGPGKRRMSNIESGKVETSAILKQI